MDPGDAATWWRLGLDEQWRLGSGVTGRAIADLQRAAEIDPRSADLWMDLADAYGTAGDPADARKAYEAARADDPISAEVAWRYGGFLLAEGSAAQSYAEIRWALLVEPELTASAISECWQANPDIAPILDHVLPADPAAYSAALDFFVCRQLPDPALRIWDRQLELRLPARLGEAIPLVNELIDRDRLADAKRTWALAVPAAAWPQDGSVVFNGGFEREIAEGGFDWREVPAAGSTVALDRHVAHSGTFSLRIEFDGTANLDFHNVFQYAPVQPRTRYHFTAYLRTEALSTDSGIRFQVLDPRHRSEAQILTPNFIGTNPWTRVDADLATGPDTDLLEIALRRMPSSKFDNKIRGAAWADDVRLAPVQTNSRDGAE